MTPRIIHILETYERLSKETGEEQPLLQPASFKSAREAMAMGELGCQHATIPEDILLQLSMLTVQSNPPPGNETQGSGIPSRLKHLAETDPLAGLDWDGGLALTDVNYLENRGAALSKAISEDPVTSRGLHEALEGFKENELQSKAAIEEILKEV